jgi:hypothetical protein
MIFHQGAARMPSPSQRTASPLYAGTTNAGAMLEKLVHTGRQIPKHQVCVTFEFPDDLRLTALDEKHLIGWRNDNLLLSRQAGDAWLDLAGLASCTIEWYIDP